MELRLLNINGYKIYFLQHLHYEKLLERPTTGHEN